MKIVHICLSGLYMDGWGYQDNMLAKYHKLDGHDVSVIANDYVYDEKGNYKKLNSANLGPNLNSVDCNGVKIYRLMQKGDKIQTGPAMRVHYFGLFDTLIEISPDIIFLHNPQILDVEDIIKYIKLANINSNSRSLSHVEHTSTPGKPTLVRLYVDSHSDYSNSARNFLSKHILHGILWRNKIRKLIPYTTKFYGVLPARVDFLLERYKTPKNKTELLCMGMDTELAEKADNENVTASIREKLHIDKEDFFIITGGKIDSAKRQTLLLMDAVNKIDNPHLKLIVFGSVVDDMKEEFNSLLNTNNSKITYIGWLDANDTYPYFAAADLAIFPGRHSVMWEQVTGQGIPMIVKYWDGTTHVDVGGNVHFLYKDSSEEIKNEIEILMNKGSEYQKMKTIALENGPKHFSYRELARKCIYLKN